MISPRIAGRTPAGRWVAGAALLFLLGGCVRPARMASGVPATGNTSSVGDAYRSPSYADGFFARLPLDDLSAFQDSNGWRLVGGLHMDRAREGAVEIAPGTGILLSPPDAGADAELATIWEHGDLELDLEYMVSPGASSSILLQGRYEIRIGDGWVAPGPGVAYRAAETTYQPRVDVDRAPGLWQRLNIVFAAPRLDDRGRSLEPARLIRVVHNGVPVFEDRTLPAAAAGQADSAGSLVLRGGDGTIAFRNLRYRHLGTERVRLEGMQYSLYQAERFDTMPDFSRLEPMRTETTGEISSTLTPVRDNFALRFTGTMHVPRTGTYRFELQSTGASRLTVDGRVVVDQRPHPLRNILHARPEVPGGELMAPGTIALKAGSHSFTLVYYQSYQPIRPRLGLEVEGPGMHRQALHAPGSLREFENIVPMFLEPQGEPVVQNAFIPHGGRMRTAGVAAGDPAGVHYALDLARGALLYLWKGPFLDVTTMYYFRGYAQVAEPRGSVIALAGTPHLARLMADDAVWPDSVGPDYRLRGYVLDAERRPTFRYRTAGVDVEDAFRPLGRRGLVRTLRLTARESASPGRLWLRVAEGSQIDRLPDGSYTIDDSSYYVELEESGGARPRVREAGARQELLLPVRLSAGETVLKYTIIW